MIDVKINGSKCDRWEVFGTTSDILAELASIISNVYRSTVEHALEDKNLCSAMSKQEIHQKIRMHFVETMAMTIALTDSDIAQAQLEKLKKDISEADNTDDGITLTLSEFMEMLLGKKEDEDGDKH